MASSVLGLFGSWHWGLGLLEHPRPWYVVGGFVVALLAATTRMPWSSALAVTAVGFNLVMMTAGVGSSAPPGATADVTVLHLNLDRNQNNPTAVRELVDDADTPPAVMCLQEVTPAWERSLREALPDYNWIEAIAREDSRGVAVLLRHDSGLVADRVEVLQWLPGETDRPTLAATFRRPDSDTAGLTILSLHTKRPTSREAAELQRRELASAAAWCDDFVVKASDARHLIAIGDFNATPWSRPYRVFLAEANLLRADADGFAAGTYPAWAPWPLRLPIDLCAVSAGTPSSSVEVGPSIGSDHRPLTVGLRIE